MADPFTTPSIINDGDWSALSLMSVEYDFPFSEVGDNITFQAYAVFRMDKLAYRARSAMSLYSFPLGTAYLTKLGRPSDIGNGLYEFTDVYSMIPQQRTEYGSFTYTLQFSESAGTSNVDPSKYFYDVTYDLEESTFTVAAQFLYEYFAFSAPSPVLKARAFMLFGKLYFIGGGPILSGSRIVAEDSQVTIWQGKIWQRRTPYVSINPVVQT